MVGIKHLCIIRSYRSLPADIDFDCDSGSVTCEQVCVNTPEGFSCGCISGYELNGDGATCDGMCSIQPSKFALVDRTSSIHSSLCVQLYHEYQLSPLHVALSLIPDIDECEREMDNCDPNALCANTPGSFTCSCNDGYTGSGTTCSGIGLQYTCVVVAVKLNAI